VERKRNTRLWIVAAVVVTVVVALLPALVAYRYTAPGQRGDFVSHPWRGWSFIAAALAVPGDSELKTSGDALRKADWLFKRTAIDPREVQLLFVAAGKPYAFTQEVAGIRAGAEVTPKYRFIWEVRGTVPTGPGSSAARETAVVALLDYETGRLLYDVREDLPSDWLEAPPSPSATPASPSPAQ
jgi:hypothetical protein